MKYFRADTHVHLYPCFDLLKLIQSAFSNLGVTRDCIGILYLTLSSKEERNWQKIFDKISKLPFECLQNDGCIIIKDNEKCLLLVKGYQITTRERIEVLNLAAPSQISDSKDLQETLSEVESSGGKVILPWSPGKWFGKRGELISPFLKSYTVGDILFSKLGFKKNHHSTFNGTDPLPMFGEEKLVGSFGIEGIIEPSFEMTLSGCRKILDREVRGYGSALSLPRALLRYLRFCLASRKPI